MLPHTGLFLLGKVALQMRIRQPIQQLELGFGNITVDELGTSVMLWSFISIEKSANQTVRAFFRRY